MKLPSDIISRLKTNALQSAKGRGGHTRFVLKQWTFILASGLLLLITVSLYAAYRFNYWSNIEETVAEDDTSAASFDEAAIEKILKEFEEKASGSRTILNGVPVSPAATSTAEEV